MELDVLYAHIGSPPVVANFSALVRRIANRELPHGADIVVGVHARLLKEHRPLPFRPPGPAPPTSLDGFVVNQVEPEVKARDTDEDSDESGSSHADKPGPLPRSPLPPLGSTIRMPAPSQPPKPGAIGSATEKPLSQAFGTSFLGNKGIEPQGAPSPSSFLDIKPKGVSESSLSIFRHLHLLTTG